MRANLAGRWPHVGVTLVCPGAIATNLADNVRTLGRPQDAAAVDALRTQLADAMPPGQAGAMVLEAVRANRFWVLPNGAEFLDVVDADLAGLHDDVGMPRRSNDPVIIAGRRRDLVRRPQGEWCGDSPRKPPPRESGSRHHIVDFV